MSFNARVIETHLLMSLVFYSYWAFHFLPEHFLFSSSELSIDEKFQVGATPLYFSRRIHTIAIAITTTIPIPAISIVLRSIYYY